MPSKWAPKNLTAAAAFATVMWLSTLMGQAVQAQHSHGGPQSDGTSDTVMPSRSYPPPSSFYRQADPVPSSFYRQADPVPSSFNGQAGSQQRSPHGGTVSGHVH